MVNLKNYNVILKHFVLIITLLFTFACSPKKEYVTKIEGKQNEEFYKKESFEQVEKIKLSTIEYRFTRGPPQDFVYS